MHKIIQFECPSGHSAKICTNLKCNKQNNPARCLIPSCKWSKHQQSCQAIDFNRFIFCLQAKHNLSLYWTNINQKYVDLITCLQKEHSKLFCLNENSISKQEQDILNCFYKGDKLSLTTKIAKNIMKLSCDCNIILENSMSAIQKSTQEVQKILESLSYEWKRVLINQSFKFSKDYQFFKQFDKQFVLQNYQKNVNNILCIYVCLLEPSIKITSSVCLRIYSNKNISLGLFNKKQLCKHYQTHIKIGHNGSGFILNQKGLFYRKIKSVKQCDSRTTDLKFQNEDIVEIKYDADQNCLSFLNLMSKNQFVYQFEENEFSLHDQMCFGVQFNNVMSTVGIV